MFRFSSLYGFIRESAVVFLGVILAQKQLCREVHAKATMVFPIEFLIWMSNAAKK